MPFDNALNTGKGRDFQTLAAELIGEHVGVRFLQDEPISIGRPAKLHKFDLVSEDRRHVGECKNYAWTETGNMPSAKMAFLNEAVLYLSHVPSDVHKFIVLRLDRHARRNETLVAYYLRTYRHLLDGLRNRRPHAERRGARGTRRRLIALRRRRARSCTA
jgi:hypothetical protein